MKKRKKAKFFEKHELFKVVGLCLVIAALLTWFLEVGLYQAGEFVNDEMYRVGVSDFLAFPLLGQYYFPTYFVILLVVAGFYKFLGSMPAYQKLTDNIARKFSNTPAIFAIVVSILMAAFVGVANDYLAALALIPFFITILSKLKVDKVVGFASTFGGALIGILASSYSGNVIGVLANADSGLGIKYGYQTYPILIIFSVSLLLLGYFIWRKCRKETEEANLLTDPFGSEVLEGKSKKELRKIKTTPLAILLVLFILNIVLGVIDWETHFGITLFTDIYESINSAVLFGTPVFQYVLGNMMTPFGSWDLLVVSFIMLITAFLIKLVYGIPFDKMVDEFVEGCKRIVPTVGIMLMIVAISLLPRFYPTLANFVHSILASGTSVLYIFASSIVNSLFAPDFAFGFAYTSGAYSALGDINNTALAIQSGFGFVTLFAPTSLLLMTGLSMLKVRYSEWIKFIWKYVLLVLILLIAVLMVL